MRMLLTCPPPPGAAAAVPAWGCSGAQTSQEPPPLPALSTGIALPSDDRSETISSFLYFAQHPRKSSLCIQ